MEGPVISTSDLRKEFEDVTALDNINLRVEHGVFGFIGPNGAGKTTLIRILVGLIRPTAGKAEVLGLDVRRDSFEIRKRIGVLHEKPSFPKHMSCLGYLERVAKLYGVDPSSARKLCDSVGLFEARERQIGKLSAGMLQRLGIAQAFAGKPELLILDEPTSNLDVVGRSEILNLILKMHHETGVSFFVSSHILSELEKVCHSVAFILSGRIIEKGEMTSVIEKYTKGRYKLTVSDPTRLLVDIRNIDHVTIDDVSDSTGIILNLDPKYLNSVKTKIYDVAESLDIVVRSFAPVDSLEDAFREAIRIEKKK
jgi:ABC-2 type transport system ATP-binding protein